MKIIFTLLFITILSCQNEKKEESKNTESVEQPQTVGTEQKSPQFSKNINEKNEKTKSMYKMMKTGNKKSRVIILWT